MNPTGAAWLVVYVGVVVLANVLTTSLGPVQVGFGLVAPGGVYLAGLGFTARDFVQESLGRSWATWAVVLGSGLSALVSPGLALASGVAFLVSEMLDMLVYTPLRARQWLTAVVCSNVVGSVADSVIFVWLAFGSLDLWRGQVVGKLAATAVMVPVLFIYRRRRAR